MIHDIVLLDKVTASIGSVVETDESSVSKFNFLRLKKFNRLALFFGLPEPLGVFLFSDILTNEIYW